MSVEPYKSTPVFTRATLPKALCRSHALKAGAWGVLNLLSGRLRYVIVETGEERMLVAGDRVTVFPEQAHYVEPDGDIELRIEFYDRPPVTP